MNGRIPPLTVTKSDRLPLRNEQEIVLARQMVRKLSQEMAFSLVDQTKMVTAASELARNALSTAAGANSCGRCFARETRRGCGWLSSIAVRELQIWTWP